MRGVTRATKRSACLYKGEEQERGETEAAKFQCKEWPLAKGDPSYAL